MKISKAFIGSKEFELAIQEFKTLNREFCGLSFETRTIVEMKQFPSQIFHCRYTNEMFRMFLSGTEFQKKLNKIEEFHRTGTLQT